MIMKRVINKEYEHLTDFVCALPEGTFDNEGKVIYDGRNRVKIFDVDGRKIVVKRFKQPHKLNRFVYSYFRGTKAERAYRNALALEQYGVDTPKPIAYIDMASKGLVTNSYLVTEYTDYLPIKDLFKEEKFFQVMGMNAFVKFTVSLHEKGIQHNDYNLTNVLYRKNEDHTFDFMLIDINRMEFGYMSKRKCMSNLRRFCHKPVLTYVLSQKYAEVREWDRYSCLIMLSLYRSMFEKRNKAKGLFKGNKLKLKKA